MIAMHSIASSVGRRCRCDLLFRRILVFSGRLPAAEGAVFLKAMDVLVQTVGQQEPPNQDRPSQSVSTETSEHRHCTLESDVCGFPLAAATAKRLACDATLVTVLEDSAGHVLNVGHRTRTIPPAIRRALMLRDGGCRFPGCCKTRFVDAHHIHHWCDGGETSLDNLIVPRRSS